jgi:translation initiation factor IF-3
VVRFLKGDDRVKVTIMFRGREQTHPERGVALLMRLAEDVSELGVIDQRPIQDGRNMTMLLSPVPKKVAEDEAEQPPADGTGAPAGGAESAKAETPAAEAKPTEANAPPTDAEPADVEEAPTTEAKAAKAAKPAKPAAKPAKQAESDDAPADADAS